MPEPALIEIFPNPQPGRDYLITHRAYEFTSVCPLTAQPDFATLILRYIADASCIELRSLKRYLHSFRNEGIFYEDVTNRILDDLVGRCAPRAMEIRSRWRIRGGIDSIIIARHGDTSSLARFDGRPA